MLSVCDLFMNNDVYVQFSHSSANRENFLYMPLVLHVYVQDDFVVSHN